jgi:subtilase family serine protease
MFGKRPRRLYAACGAAATLILTPTVAAQTAPPTAVRTTSATSAASATFAMHTQHERFEGSYQGPLPCSRYYSQKTAYDVPNAYSGRNPLAVCGYTPEQLRSAYNLEDSPYTGKGVTIAVVDAYASPTMLADATRYAHAHDETLYAPGQYREVLPPEFHHLTDGVCEAPSDWGVEEALDVEAAHATAPDARIVYVAAASCDDADLMAALASVVDQHLATIVSDSWGGVPHGADGDEDPAVTAQYDALFQRGAAQGVSFLFASGDCGAEDPSTDCGNQSARPQTDYPAQSAYVTAVGGTSLAVTSGERDGGEIGWGDRRSLLTADGSGWSPQPPQPAPYRFGSGGGTSEDVAQPAYQAGHVPASLAGTLLTGAPAPRPMRVVPDVAMDADPMTGFLIGVTEKRPDGGVGYTESAIGGTSLATPLFAGVVADAEQKAGHPLGFLNPALYAHAGTGAFRDVTGGALRGPLARSGQPTALVVDLGTDSAGARQARLYQLGDDGLLHAGSGFDDVTGLGSPGPGFLAGLG